MFKKILVPLDGSRLSSRALPYAIDVAKCFKAEIILLRVTKPTTPVVATGNTGIVSPQATEMAIAAATAVDKKNTARAKRYLNTKAQKLKVADIQYVCRVFLGKPADTIIKLSQKEHIDLIIMSSRGKSGLKRAILGSITDQVVRLSGKPVLVIGQTIKFKNKYKEE